MDCNMRRGAYIGETVELLELFQYAHPLQKLSAIQTYSCSFYGSNLYDLYGPAANQLYRAWQISVRDALGVSRATRNYIVDHLLSVPFPHIRQLMLRRYVKFVKVCRQHEPNNFCVSILGCKNKEVYNREKCGQHSGRVWAGPTKMFTREHQNQTKRHARKWTREFRTAGKTLLHKSCGSGA